MVRIATVLVFACMFAAAPAAADVYVSGYGGTTDTRTGQHGNLTVGANFTYSDPSEDIRRVVVDTPAGGVGNPNAIPFEDRCPPSTFETGECPASSQIGVVELDAMAMDGLMPIPLNLTGSISIIQMDPEVPTIVGAYLEPAPGFPVRAKAEFYPVTAGPDGDFRIRSVTDDFPRTVDLGPPIGEVPMTITRYQQLLWGVLPSGVPFITNPTRCETWMSYGYAQAYDTNTNAEKELTIHDETQMWVSSGDVATVPDCSTTPELPIKASATVSTGVRKASPALTTTLEVPGVGVGNPAPDAAKTVIATLPKAINADFMQLDRICPRAALATDSCPANTRIGGARAQTPMIVAGLAGDVYMTEQAPGKALPDIAIVMRGAIKFTVRGTNRYVNSTQIETTFDNLPQPGYSRFDLTIDGGPTGLLKNIECPAGQDPPVDGSFGFRITGYTGRTVNTEVPMSFEGCYGIATIKRTKCAVKRLNVRAYYRSRANIRQVRMYVNGRRAAISRRSPFKLSKSVLKYSKGRKRLTLRAIYKDGKVVKKSTVFKVC